MLVSFGAAMPTVASITYVALAADHLVAVELGGQDLQGRLDQTTTETEDQVESGLLY